MWELLSYVVMDAAWKAAEDVQRSSTIIDFLRAYKSFDSQFVRA